MERFDPHHVPGDWTAEDLALLDALVDATATPVHMSYRLAPEWAEGVHRVLDDLEALAARRPTVCLELIEHGLARLDCANLDDSDGWITQFCERLAPLHAEAAAAAGLPANELARRLARLKQLGIEPFRGLVDMD